MANHGWRGRGQVQAARLAGGRIVVRFAKLWTQSGRLQRMAGDLFRKELSGLGPTYDPFDVSIWILQNGQTKRLDVDNVAKACLDALTGVLWRDDSQVMRLEVQKLPDEQQSIVLLAAPSCDDDRRTALEALLTSVDAADD